MQSIWPYLTIAVIVSIIITLAVIGSYEILRNTQLWAKERRVKRYNAERAAQAAKHGD